MPLQAELDMRREAWEASVGPEVAARVRGDIAALGGSGILDRMARAGDPFPTPPSLLDPHGYAADLADLLARRPTIVTFYRGGWCPYCSAELRAYQSRLPDIEAAGGRLVAISPERSDNSMTTVEKNALSFPVLSDAGGRLADALGIRFELSQTLRDYYEKAGHPLPVVNGDGRWTLPLPATYVVEPGGRIALAHADPDYRRRLDPETAIEAVRALARATAV